MAREVQEKAKHSHSLSQGMLETLDQSKGIIGKLVTSVQNISKDQENSLEAVERLENNATEVEKIITLVVERIQGQVSYARQEASKGEESNVAIANVSSSVNEVADAVGHISDLMDKQLETMEATSKESQEVAAIAEETTAGTEEVSASIQEQNAVIEEISQMAAQLEQQAQQLNRQIHKFEK
ncbi:hypothetical protein GCM10008986_11150 [Salinibacillus aidingensis]|uniref:Methyl-accepting chemotaxis protein n=1 Tax=Salinibacillus aidingensis TaxID=237684 RepID=A0ABN1AZZ4_9BACI